MIVYTFKLLCSEFHMANSARGSVASSDLYLSGSSNPTFLLLYYYGIYSNFFTVNSVSLKYDNLRILVDIFMEFYYL